MPIVVEGSCVCGDVRFRAPLELSAGTTRCACATCRKTGAWTARTSASAFRLLAGEDVLRAVQPSPCGLRMRCGRCGVEPFALAEDDETVRINVRCLDDVDLGALATAGAGG